MPFAAALSEHPVAADAVGEVLGAIVEQRGVEPDLVVVFASAAHVEFLGEISAAVRTVLARAGVGMAMQDLPPQRISLVPHLIVRESSGPATTRSWRNTLRGQ